MHPRSITVDLLSDTTFYQGGGTPGVVDIEIQHDELGLPYLSGKTVRGLILDSWLSLCGYFPELEQAAKRIFGSPGEMFPTSILRIGDAVVASNVREWVTWAERREHNPITPEDVLSASQMLGSRFHKTVTQVFPRKELLEQPELSSAA